MVCNKDRESVKIFIEDVIETQNICSRDIEETSLSENLRPSVIFHYPRPSYLIFPVVKR